MRTLSDVCFTEMLLGNGGDGATVPFAGVQASGLLVVLGLLHSIAAVAADGKGSSPPHSKEAGRVEVGGTASGGVRGCYG